MFIRISPEGYNLPSEYTKLAEECSRCEKDDKVWICKPVGQSQGKGIFLFRVSVSFRDETIHNVGSDNFIPQILLYLQSKITYTINSQKYSEEEKGHRKKKIYYNKFFFVMQRNTYLDVRVEAAFVANSSLTFHEHFTSRQREGEREREI